MKAKNWDRIDKLVDVVVYGGGSVVFILGVIAIINAIRLGAIPIH